MCGREFEPREKTYYSSILPFFVFGHLVLALCEVDCIRVKIVGAIIRPRTNTLSKTCVILLWRYQVYTRKHVFFTH